MKYYWILITGVAVATVSIAMDRRQELPAAHTSIEMTDSQRLTPDGLTSDEEALVKKVSGQFFPPEKKDHFGIRLRSSIARWHENGSIGEHPISQLLAISADKIPRTKGFTLSFGAGPEIGLEGMGSPEQGFEELAQRWLGLIFEEYEEEADGNLKQSRRKQKVCGGIGALVGAVLMTSIWLYNLFSSQGDNCNCPGSQT